MAALIGPALIYGVYWAYKNKKQTHAIAFASLFLVILGYSIYAGVILRANVSNLPINENEPKNLPGLVSYLSREQYGDVPFCEEGIHRNRCINALGQIIQVIWIFCGNTRSTRCLTVISAGSISAEKVMTRMLDVGWNASSGTKMLIIIGLSALLLASMYFYSSQKYLYSLVSVILLLVVGAAGFWSTAFKAIPFLIKLLLFITSERIGSLD